MTDPDAVDRPDGHDRLIDATLRDVPVPAEIAVRMAVETLFDDPAIDRLLGAVSVPSGLALRIRRAAAGRADPPAPVSPPLARVHSGPPRPAGRRGGSGSDGLSVDVLLSNLFWDGAAVAAALAIVAGMFMAGTALSRLLAPAAGRDGGRDTAAVLAAARTPAETRTNPAAPRPAARGTAGGDALPGAVPPAAEQALSRPAAVESGAGAPAPVAVPRPVAVRAAPPLPEASAPSSRRGRASDVRTVFLPEATRRVPLVPGFDLAFEMAHGEAPFVDPRVPGLDLDRPPLSLRCDSFDAFVAGLDQAAKGAVARTRRSGPAAMRVEELLAAVSPPAAEDEVAAAGREGVRLSVGAFRSLRKSPESMLVELCATASWPAAGPPVDALVVIDQSSGPGALLAWQWACRGLARIASLMRTADRLSVVVCGVRPRLAALRADAAGVAGLAEELRREPPAQVADIDAGLRLVAEVSRREGAPRRIVVLAHAGSLEQCRGEGRSAFAAWQAGRAGTVAAPAAGGAHFVRIDPQQAPADGAAADPGGVALDGVAVVRSLVEHVWGRSTLVARACRMEVRFDPDAVRAYRIVGHRQTAADALAAHAAPATDLHAGETLRVVYEVARRQSGAAAGAREPISARLRWTLSSGDEISAQVGLAAAGISDFRRGTSASPHACELLLAMGLGEWATGSAHAEPPRQFAAAVAALAASCRDRGSASPTLGRLVEGVEREGILRADPGGR